MRLIDADVAVENIEEWLNSVGTALIGKGLSYTGELMGCIEDAPTIDAVPVIRCRDCAIPHNEWTGCPKLNGLVTPPDFHCAYGKPVNPCKVCLLEPPNCDMCKKLKRKGGGGDGCL